MWTRVAIAIVVFLGAGIVTIQPMPEPALADAARSNGRVAFFATGPDTGNAEIFTSRIDGSDLRQHTHTSDALESNPVWSPDGTHLAYIGFQHRGDRHYFIKVINMLDGSEILHGENSSAYFSFTDLDWSPGGSYLAHAYDGEIGYSAVWGPGGRRLTKYDDPYSEPTFDRYPDVENADAPSWSPTGREIAFNGRGEDDDIFIINRWGNNLRRIRLEGYEASPTWSPDGQRLLLEKGGHIWTMAPDGSDLERVVTNAWDPTWSPDGSKIMFSSDQRDPDREEEFGIFVADADGEDRNVKWVAAGGHADWQPVPTGRCTTVGTAFSDWISGRPMDDVMCLGDGDDVAHGMGGDDVIYGGNGNDRLFGRAGADLIHGGAGADDIKAGRGPDLILGKGGDDTLRGDRGEDEVRGNAGDDSLRGGPGSDWLRGGVGRDWCNPHPKDRLWSCEER